MQMKPLLNIINESLSVHFIKLMINVPFLQWKSVEH